MILGVGLDLADIEHITRAIENPRFLERVYSEEERAQIEQKGAQGIQTAAGYWAAKEAVAKALGTGFRGFNLWDISVRNDELGKPEAVLKGGALTRLKELGGEKIVLSITHSGGIAAAVAILSTD